MQDLCSYIEDLLKKGYDINTIKNGLLRYGYPERTIDQAIYNIKQPKTGIQLSMTSIVIIVAIILILAVASFFVFFKPEQTPKQTLSLSIDTIKNEISPGDFLTATYTFSTTSKQKGDVYIKYEIFKESDNSRLDWKSDNIPLETVQKDISIKIPENSQEGNYILQVTARYNAQSAKATEKFKIAQAMQQQNCTDGIKNGNEEDIDCGGNCPSCTKKCPASCEDNNPSTIDYCDSATKECVHEKPAVCGDNICSDTENINSCPDDCQNPITPIENPWDELDRIKELAKSDCSEAVIRCGSVTSEYKDRCLQNVAEICQDANTCDKIENDMQKESCFANVAKALNKPALCENIKKESRRDSCYVNFAVDGDYTVCDKVVNPYLKKSCETLKQASQ